MALTTMLYSPLRWFRKPAKTDYEEVLADLSSEIETTSSNLVQIRARTRRASLILPFWASLVWLMWTVACYYLGLLQYEAWIAWWPIVAAPITIFFARSIVKWWYKRVQSAEERHLKNLQRQRREKIDEIKKATRYDHLRKLLEKYDDEGKGSSPRTPQTPTQQQPARAAHGLAHSGVTAAGVNNAQAAGRKSALPSGTPGSQQLPSAMRAAPPGALARPVVANNIPLQRTWLDRIADAVLGADSAGGSLLGPEQKYALICSHCKKHNGLATREEFNEIQYVCPNCGAFETRRPSSFPVSSPWRLTSSVEGATPSPSGSGSHAKHSTDTPASAFRTTEGPESKSDSPPPASPLAAVGQSGNERLGGGRDDRLGPIGAKMGDM